MDERHLLRAIAGKDRQAFEELFRLYEARLFRYFVRLVRDEEAAEELTSDVLFEVWKKAGTYREDSRPSTWIFGIAHHKGVSHLRRKPKNEEAIELAAGFADAQPGPEENLDRTEREKRLSAALERLSADHREVLELAYLQGLRLQEIAAIQGCPINTVKTRLYYAKQRLRPWLAAIGGLSAGGTEPSP